ncbi:MAG: hypothetical protein ABF743_13825 [Schleiferilactobacillus perolens]|uniref:hypothetical protein n=1 Tax=Schleiferilactobacillus perolens TaxID=100468 RepID=UPI0039EA07E4
MTNEDAYHEISDLDPAEGVFAGEVKTRKTGNSISLTVPKTAKPKDGIQYNTIVFPDGTIVYKPIPQSQEDKTLGWTANMIITTFVTRWITG